MRYKSLLTVGLISVLIGVAGIFSDLAIGLGFLALLLGLVCIISGFAMYLLRTPTAEDVRRQDPRNSATWHISRGGCFAFALTALIWLGVTFLLERYVPALQQKLGTGWRSRNVSLAGLVALFVAVPPTLWLFRNLRHYYIDSEHGDDPETKHGDDSVNATSTRK
jgi:uncharacterized membrane-anchored protein